MELADAESIIITITFMTMNTGTDMNITTVITVKESNNAGTGILQRNNLLAERNKGYFEAKHIFCLNLMSSPGSSKTTLLEETIRQLNSDATLVCPATFDLGEAKKVVIVSTPKGMTSR